MMKGVHTRIFDPATVHFSRGPGDVLELRIKGENSDSEVWPRVWVFRSYPLSYKNEFLSVRDASCRDLPEIGLISNLREFPAETQELITSELERRYFMPLITEVVSIKEARDRLEWDVVTTKGRRQFTVRNAFDNIRSLGDERLLITDIYNCRYEMRGRNALSDRLRDILSKYIYL
jgi:hypothetical protein